MAYWLDEGFDTWPEIVRVGSAAAGFYVRCGVWIARNLTDGFVPAEVARMYGTPEWIQKLVDVGLWTIEGDGFLDARYLDLNPARTTVEKRKASHADRQRRYVERKRVTDASPDASVTRSPALKQGRARARKGAQAQQAGNCPKPGHGGQQLPCLACASDRKARKDGDAA